MKPQPNRPMLQIFPPCTVIVKPGFDLGAALLKIALLEEKKPNLTAQKER